jgi:hypothetical protein
LWPSSSKGNAGGESEVANIDKPVVHVFYNAMRMAFCLEVHEMQVVDSPTHTSAYLLQYDTIIVEYNCLYCISSTKYL